MLRPLLPLMFVSAVSIVLDGQPAATLSVDRLLSERLGTPQADVARMTAGEAVVWTVPASVGNEVAAAGAVRITGDMRRLLVWLRDIEAFMRASGTVNVGAIGEPAAAADFDRLNLDDVDLGDLASCRPGRCDFRMPAPFIDRFQKEVAWSQADARVQASSLARTLIREYVTAYQAGGDSALGAHHDQKEPNAVAGQFQDMLRRATKVWDLAYPFVSYLESFPAARPGGTESRFYWTRDKVGLKPILTLHHVVLQEFPDGRALLADKQFYASRQFDAGLLIALAVPIPGRSGFDLVVSVKVRAGAVGGVAGRVLKGRIQKEMAGGLKMYLEWIRGSMAL